MTHPSRKTRILATCPTGPGSDLLGGFQFTGMQTVDPPGDHLTIATSMYREMDRRIWLEQAEADRNTEEAGMELDPRTDRLPFHDPDEAEQACADATAPSHDARIRHLQRVPLFSGFNEDELRRVAELSRIVEAQAGTVVTQIGEPGDSFFIIIDGAVGVRTPVGAGSELHPGDFFGEMSLLDGEPRSATIVATTDLRLLIVDRSHFWRLLDETPDLVRRILTILSRRVRRLEQTVHAILRGTNPT